MFQTQLEDGPSQCFYQRNPIFSHSVKLSLAWVWAPFAKRPGNSLPPHRLLVACRDHPARPHAAGEQNLVPQNSLENIHWVTESGVQSGSEGQHLHGGLHGCGVGRPAVGGSARNGRRFYTAPLLHVSSECWGLTRFEVFWRRCNIFM